MRLTFACLALATGLATCVPTCLPAFAMQPTNGQPTAGAGARLLAPKNAPGVSPRPGDVPVALRLKVESAAAWQKLAALGWVLGFEQRVMTELPDGKRGCIVVYEGTMPPGAIAKARRLPEVLSLQPITPRR